MGLSPGSLRSVNVSEYFWRVLDQCDPKLAKSLNNETPIADLYSNIPLKSISTEIVSLHGDHKEGIGDGKG